MWRINSSSNELEVKIIDFDSAHFIGDNFGNSITVRLFNRRRVLAYHYGKHKEWNNYFDLDISFMELLKNHSNNINLQSCEKRILDMEFRKITENEFISVKSLYEYESNTLMTKKLKI